MCKIRSEWALILRHNLFCDSPCRVHDEFARLVRILDNVGTCMDANVDLFLQRVRVVPNLFLFQTFDSSECMQIVDALSDSELSDWSSF